MAAESKVPVRQEKLAPSSTLQAISCDGHRQANQNVRLWNKADIEARPAHVRFCVQSGPRTDTRLCPLMTQIGPNVPAGFVRKCRQASGPRIQ